MTTLYLLTIIPYLDGGLTVRYKDVQIARFEHKLGVPLKIGKFIPACDYSHTEVNQKAGNRQTIENQKSGIFIHQTKTTHGNRIMAIA